MEFDDDNDTVEQDDSYVEIYSKRAIFWFAILASPVFGAVLLLLNLKAAGLMKGFYTVLAFLVFYMLAVNIFIGRFMLTHKINFNVPDQNLFIFYGISLILNVAGAVILTFYFFKKYFPDDDYYPKSITTPIIITVLTIIVLRIIGLGI